MGPSTFEFEVSGDGDCEKLIGPFHKEGFSSFCKIWIEHPSASKAVRNVVDDVLGDLDPKLGAVGGLVDFAKSFIHSVFEVFEIFSLLPGQSVHDVPLMGWREFRGRFDSGLVPWPPICSLQARCQTFRSWGFVEAGPLRSRKWNRRCFPLEDEPKE